MDYLFGLNVVEAGRIDPHRVAAYDSAFQVLVSIGVDNKTRVYCREAWPYALSNPVFDPATVYGLKGNTVKVRLTGQEGEPCPGWWVHWELAGGLVQGMGMALRPSIVPWLSRQVRQQDGQGRVRLEHLFRTRRQHHRAMQDQGVDGA